MDRDMIFHSNEDDANIFEKRGTANGINQFKKYKIFISLKYLTEKCYTYFIAKVTFCDKLLNCLYLFLLRKLNFKQLSKDGDTFFILSFYFFGNSK